MRVIKGTGLLTHISENKSLQEKISNGTSACAIDYVDQSRKQDMSNKGLSDNMRM